MFYFYFTLFSFYLNKKINIYKIYYNRILKKKDIHFDLILFKIKLKNKKKKKKKKKNI